MQALDTKDLDVQPNFTKKLDIMRLLGHLCQELDLTDSQIESAKSSYEAVGQWLSESGLPELRSAIIYAQGSTALGTTNRPIRGNEFDVDLVHHLPGVTTNTDPATVKRLIGARLSEHEHYRSILEEKQRCWRLNYAGQYHLDITPSIMNPSCSNGGELVPDRKLRQWKATNPKGYLRWFETHAAIEPQFVAAFTEARARAEVQPFPEPEEKKGLLRRTIQICKRHRDIYFSTRTQDLAPVSIVITTLTAKSYAHCVNTGIYISEIDLLIDVIRTMPMFIQMEDQSGRPYYLIPNETTEGENFADKWNVDSRLPVAFFEWHRGLTDILGGIEGQRGLDIMGNTLSAGFGEAVVKPAVARFVGNVSAARSADQLSIMPGVGLASSAVGVRVQRNTFFGQ